MAQRFQQFHSLVAEARAVTRARADASLTYAWERHAHAARRGEVTGATDVARWALDSLAGSARLIEPVASMLTNCESHAGVGAVSGALSAIQTLRSRGSRLGLICNSGLISASTTRRLLRREGLLGAFDVVVFSDELGALKPDRRPFQAALAQLGIRAGRCVHVGDDRRTDVAGARAAGMQTLRLTAVRDDSSGLDDADAVVGSFRELLAALQTLRERRGAGPRSRDRRTTRWPAPSGEDTP